MAKKHIHRYRKVSTGLGDIWACSLPDCTHYMPQHLTELLLGRTSVCWGCGENMILTSLNMENSQPQCSNCKGEADLVAALNERNSSDD